MKQQQRNIAEIAREINQVWVPVHIDANPYLNAMLSIKTPNDLYGKDTGKEIVEWFLHNSTMWTGLDAERIKAELRVLITPINFEVGDEVYWNDPDGGTCSGLYTVKDKLVDDGNHSVWLIVNVKGSEVEVFQFELS